MPGAPGPFAELLGAHIDQTFVLPEPITLVGELSPAEAKIWAEHIAIDQPGVTTLLRYPASADWLNNAPAVVTRTVGKGRITYIGAWLDPAGLRRTMAWAAAMAGTRPVLADMPDGIEVTARDKAGRRLIVAINWSQSPKTLTLPVARVDLLTGTKAARFMLEPFGVVIFETPK